MNIHQAREAIRKANAENSTELDLSAYDSNRGLDNIRLTSKDLVELLPEIKELTNLTTIDLSNNQLSDIEILGQLTNLTTLDLSGNQISDIEILGQLTNLTTLNLSYSQFSDIEILGQLTNLTTLNLSYSQFSDIEILGQLTNLTTLNLSYNRFGDIEILGQLTNLTTLYISHNKISDIEILGQLTNLTTLDLSGNQISDIEILGQLTGLTTLYLSGNQISDIEILGQLTGLTTLYLSGNQISDIEILGQLTGLTTLYLSGNQISDIEILGQLTGLTNLDLSGNRLSDIETLGQLTELTRLDLDNNEISDISILTTLRNLSTFFIFNNPSLNLSKNLKQLINDNQYRSLDRTDIEEIIKYYEQLEEGKDFIYEAKVLVVGEPQAGKTTLTQKVRDNDNWHREMKNVTTESTVGVNVVTVPFTYNRDTSKEIKAHFWDFGGHRAQYVLHQYFFTESSLYIVLADGRKEFPNFNYWFEIIATLGKGCPVLVVLNENECQPIQTFNINEYRREFGSALESIEEKSVNFYDDQDSRFSLLVSEIQNKVSNLKHIGQALPAKWVRVREDIEKLKESRAYITKDEFLEVCRKRDLTRRDYQQQVLEYLHILGIALNYKSDVNLRNKLILKPEWVIDALYVVLKNKKIEDAKGVFEVEYVDELWEREGYSSTDRDILLGLMQKNSFEIAYRLGSSDKFIVPILLPFKPKDYSIDGINPTQMQIEYAFMPKGILSRLIVRLNKNIVTDGEQIVWNKGVLLEHHNSKAEVIESEQSKQISIKVVGENKNHNKELLTIIRNEIVGIHRDWFDSRLNFEELVPCNCEKCNELRNKYDSLRHDEVKSLSDDERKRLSLEPYKLFELEERLRNNVATVECRKSYKSVNIYDLIQEIYVVEREKRGEMPNINISNIDGKNISLNVNAGVKDSTVRNSVSQELLPVDADKKTD